MLLGRDDPYLERQMGASVSSIKEVFDCDGCLAPVMNLVDGGEAAEAEQNRLAFLVEGATFSQKVMAGLGSSKVQVNLSEDHSSLDWRIEKTMLMAESYGSVDLTSVSKVSVDGQKGFRIFGSDQKEELFSAISESTEIRDRWVIALNELLDRWKSKPETKPKRVLSAAKTSDKAEYFARREKEMEQRKLDAQKKREKYAGVGMKHTAAAMMRA